MPTRKSYKVFMGALQEVPIYEEHKRGKNWLSVVSPDPTQPGGLKRERVPYAHGDYFYMVNGLRPGDVLEFGADYFTTGGKRIPRRLYAIVSAITDTELILDLFKSPQEAFEAKAAMEFNSAPAPEKTAVTIDLSKVPTEELIAELRTRGIHVDERWGG